MIEVATIFCGLLSLSLFGAMCCGVVMLGNRVMVHAADLEVEL